MDREIKVKNMEKTIIESVLNFYPSVSAVYLFGSYASEEYDNKSDIDIAILLTPGEKIKKSFELQFRLETLLNLNIDIILLREVNTVLQKEIIISGRRIFCSDEYIADEFEMLVISKYQKLNEERREIIKDALKSGEFISS